MQPIGDTDLKTLPQVVYEFKSDAERKVFKALQGVDLGTDAVALHSLNLREHAYKQWAEADFVIICSHGVMVLEVKGGGVSHDASGNWHFTNRHGQNFRKSESPLDQARTARFALEKLIGELIDDSLPDRINFGWGCIFPDVPFRGVYSAEIADEMILDSRLRSSSDLQSWLSNLYQFWKGRTKRKQLLKSDDILRLQNAMRPSFDLVPSLGLRVRNVLDNQLKLTGEQYDVLDSVLINDRAVITGGAGTGKTVLAMEACRRLAAMGNSPLLVCRNRMLADRLQRELHRNKVIVMHLENLFDAVERGFLPRFSHLVIDEGQDILEQDAVLKLDAIVEGGLSGGHWIMFMDTNNQGSMYGAIDHEVLECFTSTSARFVLSRNVRNTPEICRHLSWYTGVTFEREGELGLAVKVDDSNVYEDRTSLAEIVENQLDEWFDCEDINPADITILSPCIRADSIVNLLPAHWKRRIRTVSENTAAVSAGSVVRFSQIRDFKGLDSPFVLMVDLEYLDEDKLGVVQLYVGMSRANAVLVMPIPHQRRKYFRKLKQQAQALHP